MSIDLVVLDEDQQLELSRIAQSRALPAGYVFRAKLILMLAGGASFRTIKQRLGTTAPTIIRWKRRFVADGLDGLDTSHPGQPASVLTPKLRARILSATRRQPKDGSTHWSCRKLAAALGVSKDAVHRVWKEAGLKPHRLERYMVSDDPEFETKAADIIGLYLHPPQHAAVFCVDEKTAIQALDRLDPVVSLYTGGGGRAGFVYYRHGTLSLYAAFTPTYSSWLNQVELWFSKIERDVIARGVFTSLPDVKRKLMRYIRQYNTASKTVKWKYFDPTRRITPQSAVTAH